MQQARQPKAEGLIHKGLGSLILYIKTKVNNLKIEPPPKGWRLLAEITVLAGFGFGFMEWLFLVTKPSFMDTMVFGHKLVILLSVSGLIAGVGLLFLGTLWPISRLQVRRLDVVLFHVGAGIPAFTLAGLLLLMIDNFTYTVLNFGIVTSERLLRGLYAILFVGLLYLSYRQVGKWVRRLNARKPRGLWVISAGLVVVAALTTAGLGFSNTSSATAIKTGTTGQRPNILIIGSDGLSADHMSLYGYELETTPYLSRLAEDSLWAENAFSNSSNTSGSLISMLASKPPAATRVLYPPDILSGINAYQHLPGLLRNAGYTTVQLSTAYYADAYALNVQNGFDMVNGQASLEHSQIYGLIRRVLPGDVAYFISGTADRLFDRLLHIFFVRAMPNPYKTVTTGEVEVTDRQRVDQIIQLVTTTDQPVFIHAHLMGTHGPRYEEIAEPVFSAGLEQSEEWMAAFYDDSILTFDGLIKDIVTALDEAGELNNTILVIYSDHARFWKPNERIPLLIYFPDHASVGVIQENVQNLDIAPTVLDYMGWDIPEWMEGQSLIEARGLNQRIIFNEAVTAQGVEENDGFFALVPERVQPPFYQFGNVRAIICDEFYDLNLEDQTWTVLKIDGHTAPCTKNELPEPEEIKAAILQHLQDHGFEITTLENLPPPPEE